jgi:hypothetical protein
VRLPTWTAERSLQPSSGAAYSAPPPTPGFRPTCLEPMIKAGCLIGCVGTKAYECMSCGADAACWERCAGPGASDCLARCA